MPAVHHVNRARRSYGSSIRRGEPYYWWKFRHGPKLRSKSPPTRSQLTQSPFWSSLYSILEGAPTNPDSEDDSLSELRDELQSLRDETEEKAENQPQSLSNSPTAELLNARVGALDEAISTIEGLIGDAGIDNWEDAMAAVEGISCE